MCGLGIHSTRVLNGQLYGTAVGSHECI